MASIIKRKQYQMCTNVVHVYCICAVCSWPLDAQKISLAFCIMYNCTYKFFFFSFLWSLFTDRDCMAISKRENWTAHHSKQITYKYENFRCKRNEIKPKLSYLNDSQSMVSLYQFIFYNVHSTSHNLRRLLWPLLSLSSFIWADRPIHRLFGKMK